MVQDGIREADSKSPQRDEIPRFWTRRSERAQRNFRFFSHRPAGLSTHRVCRAWEYEADIDAAYMVTSSLFSDENRVHFAEVFDLEVSEGDYERDVVWTWFFASHTLFLYLGQRVSRFRWRAHHPPPLVRSAYIFGQVAPQLALEKRTRLSAKDLAVLQLAACGDAERAWSQLVRPARTMSESQIIAAIDRLTSDLTSLRASYSEYSWFPDRDPRHTGIFLSDPPQRRSRRLHS
jgi:hypothetical protein